VLAQSIFAGRVISNLSDEPVYDVNVFMSPRRFGVEKQNTFYCSLLPPGETLSRKVTRDPPKAAPKTVPRVEVAFTTEMAFEGCVIGIGSLSELVP
jgi:hypothetical protein